MAATIGIATLSLTQADGTVSTLAVADGQTVRVGRADTNDMVLDDPGISRMHAAFSASGSGLIVNDLSSLNGTFVNGKRINAPVDLSSKDIVDIGPFKISVQICDPAQEVIGNGQRARTMTLALRPVSLTILAVNVKGYSRFAQSLPKDDVDNMLNMWLAMVTKVITDQGGAVDKRLDDRVVALWSGMDSKELAEKAVRAGLEINRHTWEMCRTGKWLHDQTYPWDCKVAVHSAHGLLGSMRGEKNFGVLGDGMNIVFRISDIASKSNHDVMLSGETLELLKDLFKAEEVKLPENDEGEIKIKTFAIDPLSPQG